MENNFNELKDGVLKERNIAALKGLPWLLLALALSYLALNIDFIPLELSVGTLTTGQILFLVSLFPWMGVFIFCQKFAYQQNLLSEASHAEAELRLALGSSSIDSIEGVASNCREQEKQNPLVSSLLESRLPGLQERIRKIRKDEALAALNGDVYEATQKIGPFLSAEKDELPIFKARAHIKTSLEFLERRRGELQQQWDDAYAQFSWWNKLKYSGGPDFSELDRIVKDLRVMERQLIRRHEGDFRLIESHFEKLKKQATARVLEARREAENYIRECDGNESIGSGVLRKSMWLSMLSIPVSVWADFDRASDVFVAARSVNGNFVGMSDFEIWWETLFMPAESLAGLAALTKGAYFEQLVASDMGGQLHEHFNNPGTDIVVDGTAFQIKATDSETYIHSVADGIPVIATSEVAIATGSIDSGYSNEELSNATDLALGNTVVDLGDTTVDAVLAGVGGLGFFATLEGLNHAVKKHENGGDGVEAMFEGAGVAIEGTARALVGAAEMGYKVLSSKPSRFVGRMMLKGLVKLDEKMTAESPTKR